MRSPRDERGQASVELVAVLPALWVAALIAAQLAVVGFALWSAASAARTGARASAVGAAAEAAARRAIPAPFRDGAEVDEGEAVEVTVRAPLLVPGLEPVAISASAALDPAADAGAAVQPAAPTDRADG